MKRLIVSGAVLLGCFSSIVTGCGSRSSDTEYLPDITAGAATGRAGSSGSAGDEAIAGAATAGATAAGAGGLGNAAGAAGDSQGGASFAGAGGAIGIAGSAAAVGSGGASGASLGGAGAGAGSGAGGTSHGGGGFGGSSSGSSGFGGSSGFSGSSGNTGGAGAGGSGGGNSAACPDTAPNGVCSTASLQCNYTGRSCTCRALGPINVWRCTGSGAACPASEPAAATACMGTLQCPYPDGNQCDCGTSGAWNCFTAGCPATKPTPSGSCGSVFGQCKYGTGAGSSCVCVQGGWFCN